MALKSEGKSPKTIYIYSHAIKRFAKFCGHEEITPFDVRSYISSLQDSGLKPYSLHVHYRCLRTFFNWLIADGVATETPMRNVKPPKLPKLVIKPFSKEDINNLLLACSGQRFTDLRNRAIVFLLLDTGIRLAELAGMKRIDLLSDYEILTVYGKGSKERRVHLGLMTRKAIARYMMDRKDNYPDMWLSASRKPLTKSGVQSDIRKLCLRAEIKDAKPGPHTFRHTCAVNCIRAGGNVYVLQEMLGHADQEMTRRYCSSIGIEDVINEHKRFSPVDIFLKK